MALFEGLAKQGALKYGSFPKLLATGTYGAEVAGEAVLQKALLLLPLYDM